MSEITVCIMSLNRPEYLCEAVASALAQTALPQSIIIFDNGSESSVLDAVNSYLSKDVRWIGSEVTHSAFWNFQRAIAEAETEYVLVMHDDDRLCSDFIDKQVAFLDSNPEVGAVSCNSFLINEQGQRNGRTLRSDFIDAGAELYRCSVDVALRYANDSCIPFSSAVFRTKFVRKVALQEEYGKVADAVFFCDLADTCVVAFQSERLYECRVHPGQDSVSFSPEILNKLENFLWTRNGVNEERINLLRNLLISQHTFRKLLQIFKALKQSNFPLKEVMELCTVRDRRFSYSDALKIIFNFFKNKLAGTT
ncbi:MAG: glycosyltransferase [Gallionellaceae bacterium]